MTPLSAAIFYTPDGYETGGKRLLGRQAAGEGFLRAVLRHSRCDRLFCYAYDRAEFKDFQQRARDWGLDPDGIDWLAAGDPASALQADVLYHPSPGLGPLSWRRRTIDQRGYGICGVTHTTASRAVMDSIVEMVSAPVQPWDSLICTSQALRHGVERVLDNWLEYLGQRFGQRPRIELELPIVPLGVECDRFTPASTPTGADRRAQWRQRLGIADGEIVVLFVGRLIAYAKAHPVPMYDAIERAARQTGKRVHLIQAGWFEEERDEKMFKEAMPTLCPSVNGIFLDGRDRHIRDSIWSAADIFISLADNIQETFGLTPIEAMAAGLPTVVSDWNGYKESVRHGLDGFRIPTLTPPPGSGLNLADAYYDERLNYSTYIAESASAVAIDIENCAATLVELIENPALRRNLGENGQRRAREVYDWRQVMARYDDLWEAMRDRCRSATESAPVQLGRPPIPAIEDPFRAFAHYPSQILRDDDAIALGANADPRRYKALRGIWHNRIGDRNRLPEDEVGILLKLLSKGDRRVRDLTEAIARRRELAASLVEPEVLSIDDRPVNLRRRVHLTIAYLLKFDIVRLQSYV